MSDTDTLQREADQLRAEIQRHASEAGYSDVQQYIQENENAAEVQQLAQQAQQLQQKAVQVTIKGEQERLFENAPGLRNEKTRQAFSKWLQDERGYTKEEIAGTLNHRVMTDLYRSYRSAAPRKTLPKVTKPTGDDKPNGADTDKQSNGNDASADNSNVEHPILQQNRAIEELYGGPNPEPTRTPLPPSEEVEILYPDDAA